MFSKIINYITQSLDHDIILSIILFGSFARFGKGRDIDLLVITKHRINPDTEIELSKKLNKLFNYRYIFDVHIISFSDFIENLYPPSFISGIFLGYKVLYDRIGIRNIVECFRNKLKKIGLKYTLVDRYGVWTIP